MGQSGTTRHAAMSTHSSKQRTFSLQEAVSYVCSDGSDDIDDNHCESGSDTGINSEVSYYCVLLLLSLLLLLLSLSLLSYFAFARNEVMFSFAIRV